MTLTKREQQILKLFCYKNKEIADILVVESSTVKTHTENIFKKLEEHTKPKALIRALKTGLIKLEDVETDYIDVGFWNEKGKYKIHMEKIRNDIKK